MAKAFKRIGFPLLAVVGLSLLSLGTAHADSGSTTTQQSSSEVTTSGNADVATTQTTQSTAPASSSSGSGDVSASPATPTAEAAPATDPGATSTPIAVSSSAPMAEATSPTSPTLLTTSSRVPVVTTQPSFVASQFDYSPSPYTVAQPGPASVVVQSDTATPAANLPAPIQNAPTGGLRQLTNELGGAILPLPLLTTLVAAVAVGSGGAAWLFILLAVTAIIGMLSSYLAYLRASGFWHAPRSGEPLLHNLFATQVKVNLVWAAVAQSQVHLFMVSDTKTKVRNAFKKGGECT